MCSFNTKTKKKSKNGKPNTKKKTRNRTFKHTTNSNACAQSNAPYITLTVDFNDNLSIKYKNTYFSINIKLFNNDLINICIDNPHT